MPSATNSLKIIQNTNLINADFIRYVRSRLFMDNSVTSKHTFTVIQKHTSPKSHAHPARGYRP
jgi:hypothetical protein